MAQPKKKYFVIRLLRTFAIIYFVLLLGVFLGQRHFLYHPHCGSIKDFQAVAANHGAELWQNASGGIIGWKQLDKTPGAHDRVLVVHGNAGCALDRLYYAQQLKTATTFDVYFLEYPGFGARNGPISQKNLCTAADEAVAILAKDGPIYLIGESLGTGVASYLAGTYPENIKGVLLVAPYYNLTEVGQYHMSIFPVNWMLWDRFPAADWLQHYQGPLAVLLAGRDVIVPNQFGRKLYDAYAGPKKVWLIPRAGHNDLPFQPAEWWPELINFWKANQPASAALSVPRVFSGHSIVR